jgi:hypothetical protein
VIPFSYCPLPSADFFTDVVLLLNIEDRFFKLLQEIITIIVCWVSLLLLQANGDNSARKYENVSDIQQGVSIGIMIKSKDIDKYLSKINYTSKPLLRQTSGVRKQ